MNYFFCRHITLPVYPPYIEKWPFLYRKFVVCTKKHTEKQGLFFGHAIRITSTAKFPEKWGLAVFLFNGVIPTLRAEPIAIKNRKKG